MWPAPECRDAKRLGPGVRKRPSGLRSRTTGDVVDGPRRWRSHCRSGLHRGGAHVAEGPAVRTGQAGSGLQLRPGLPSER
ncbi:hypothetical protein NDU88_002420 [Pleurodeles waltl]|uniref:Uncharacterized protein n=1 Tax=Pleurodeles waltl TaxID=8319 RepID=A0AAV7KU44_PLEWA|nr:hypothetical protein NDU88_002420 [Pleurodeles waltl]